MRLNCDMGEGYGPWSKGDDAGAMPYIDWANIACGGHAGDPDTMARTVALALEHGVQHSRLIGSVEVEVEPDIRSGHGKDAAAER